MKVYKSKILQAVATLFFVMSLNQVVFATDIEDVKKSASGTVDTAADYSKEKFDEVKTDMKKKMDDVDESISEIQTRSASAAGKTKVELDKKLEELKSKRADLEDQYKKLKKSSKKEWQLAKDRFDSVYKKMKADLRKKLED